eukprot:GEMP01105757.1.p1 GENE.GEMP01105757.1~~GEMP01105757.1.p1  ORF type:complete len:121 (-),score=9.58 GEMP01105757.1:181-543(-)
MSRHGKKNPYRNSERHIDVRDANDSILSRRVYVFFMVMACIFVVVAITAASIYTCIKGFFYKCQNQKRETDKKGHASSKCGDLETGSTRFLLTDFSNTQKIKDNHEIHKKRALCAPEPKM